MTDTDRVPATFDCTPEEKQLLKKYLTDMRQGSESIDAAEAANTPMDWVDDAVTYYDHRL